MSMKLTFLAIQYSKIAAIRTTSSHGKTNVARGMSGQTKPPIPQSISKYQERYQVNDGNNIHVKAGFSDEILYRSTMGLCIAGLGLFFYNAYQIDHKRK